MTYYFYCIFMFPITGQNANAHLIPFVAYYIILCIHVPRKENAERHVAKENAERLWSLGIFFCKRVRHPKTWSLDVEPLRQFGWSTTTYDIINTRQFFRLSIFDDFSG